MKLRRSKSPIWLSEIVQQSFLEGYPQLASLKTQGGWREKITRSFPLSFRFALIIFVAGFILNEFFIWQGWIISTYELAPQGAADVLASSLEYLAGLVGIVLPIILIIIEFVSKDKGASSLVDIYLDKTNLKTTAIWALVLLGVEAVFMTVFRANIINAPRYLFYLLFLFTLLNLAIIFETGKTIWSLRESLSDRFLVETLSTKLGMEVRRSQKIEVEYRLSRITNLDIYQALGLERSQYGHQPQNTLAILATKTGVIEDIRLPDLHKFAQLIEVSSEKTFMTKLVNDSVRESEVIAYVPPSMNVHMADLQRILNKSYRVSEVSNVNDEVKTLMAQVKQTVETSIRDENKLFFDELMSVYRQIFELGVGLPIPPSTEWLNDFIFRGWSANQIAIWHMRDFVEIVARSKNRKFVDSLSHDIFKISSSMIRNSNIVVDDNLSEVLGLYVSMYFFSHKYENELGIYRSYFHLTRDIVDRIWINSLKISNKNIQAIRNHYTILHLILGTLSRILHQAFLNNDLMTLKSLLKFIQPSEFLAYIHLGHFSSNEYFILLQKLENSSEDEKRIVEEQIEALKLVRDIPAYVEEFFNNLVFLATSYLFELYEKGERTIDQFEEMLSILNPYLLSAKQTINLFGKLIKNDSTLGRDLFTHHPETKRAYSPNDEDKLYLFYCLRGMVLVSKNDVPKIFPVDLRYQLSRIEETCNRIVAMPTKWVQTSLFLDIEDKFSGLAQKWVELNKGMADRWQVEREDQIINSDLDANKERIFVEAVKQTIQEESKNSFRVLLERYNRVVFCDRLTKQRQVWHLKQKEYFTELYPDNNYSRELGTQYGNALVRSIDACLIQKWISSSRYLPTRKDWENFQPYFDRAISRFSENGYQLSCFLVPNNRHLYMWLRKTPNFMEQFRVEIEDKLPMLEGFYKDIPVFEYFIDDDEQPFLLAVDLDKALRLKIGNPSVEIRNLTEDEIERRLDNNPDETRRNLLLLVSAKASQPFDFEILDRDAMVRMKLKLDDSISVSGLNH